MIKTEEIKLTIFDDSALETYMHDDWVDKVIRPSITNKEYEQSFICNKWLAESSAKRLIFSHVYGDIIKNSKTNLKIVDIGAGVNFSQSKIAEKHSLTVIDILAHDSRAESLRYFKESGIEFIEDDWFKVIDDISGIDLIIANDLFPNADQRLPEFLDKMRYKCKELRLVLTHYSDGRSYKVKRLSGDEIMFLRAWDDQNLVDTLCKYIEGFTKDHATFLKKNKQSLFPNNRYCSLLKMRLSLEG